MEAFLYLVICAVVFMLGACMGSFFNVLLCRIPNKEDFVKTRSHCPVCGKTLKWYELVPVFSYITQRGRCRNCLARIKTRYLLMELICGAAALWAFMALGLTYETVLAFILFPVLVSLSSEDIKKTEIPYWCTGVIAALGVISTALSAVLPGKSLWYEHLIGMFVISVPFAVFCYMGAMGGGDVQLTAAAGLVLGWAIVPSVLIAMITGGVFGIIIKLTKKRATICFGPFLSIGIAAGYLYGYEIIKWYASFLR